MSKSTLRFEFDTAALAGDPYDFPVEVRKPNLTLVARGLCSAAVEVEPGTYYVTARLPDGQELASQVQVACEETTVYLTPEQDELTVYQDRPTMAAPPPPMPHVMLEGTDFWGNFELDPPQKRVEPPQAETPEQLTGVKLRAWSGNGLRAGGISYATTAAPEWTWEPIAFKGGPQWSVVPPWEAGDASFVQLLQPHQPPVNRAVPGGRGNCHLLLTSQPNGVWTLDIHLSNTDADALLQYQARGLLKQAATIATSDALTAERLLYQKMANPVGAAVGAYALLRFGELERLHEWTANLKERFAWLPDGVTILAEHRARLGEHDAALDVLLELPSRGLPLFSDGLSYAVDRLSLYLSLGDRHFKPEPLERARTLLDQLQPYIAHADFSRPILTFTGLDPAQPDAESLSAEAFAAAEGVVPPGV